MYFSILMRGSKWPQCQISSFWATMGKYCCQRSMNGWVNTLSVKEYGCFSNHSTLFFSCRLALAPETPSIISIMMLGFLLFFRLCSPSLVLLWLTGYIWYSVVISFAVCVITTLMKSWLSGNSKLTPEKNSSLINHQNRNLDFLLIVEPSNWKWC